MQVQKTISITFPIEDFQSLIIDSVNACLKNRLEQKKIEPSPTFGKIPIQEIFTKKLLSKPTLYAHVKAGTITLYKMGGRSYVDAVEFNNAFTKVKIA